MDYKKLWNDFKDFIVVAAEKEAGCGDYKEFVFHAGDLLRMMVVAEVKECREGETRKKEIDTSFMLLTQKGE